MRFPDKRDGHYYVPASDRTIKRLPSVTSILSILAKPQLVRWAAREAARAVLEDPHRYNTVEAAASVPFTMKDDAAERGRSVHGAIQAWAEGAPLDDSNGYVRAFARFVRTVQPSPRFVEAMVWSERHGYAGTTDMICEAGGESWILDFKTSKAVYYEYHLQTAAYRGCDRLKDRDGRIHAVDLSGCRTGVVLLSPEGTYQFTETNGDFELFLHLKEAYVRLREAGQV
ncbi:MAG: hypothetical protein QN144_10245 [Armatimonadota bacterium]|nr:hypothetical protein [Armatimonadota bacterium]